MMLLDRAQTNTVDTYTCSGHFLHAAGETQAKKKFVFVAHWVENWNWLFKYNRDLSQHPDHAWRWAPMSPVFFAVSLFYLFGRKPFEQLDKFTYGDALEGRIDIIRNFGWQFSLKSQHKKIRSRILQTVLQEQERSDVIGLGALTKAEWLTAGGKWIVDELGDRLNVPIVHGDTLTAATVIKRCMEVVEKYNIKSVFVTGATSKIGRALVLYLASQGVVTRLYSNSIERFDEIRTEAGEYGKFLVKADSLDDGRDCKLWVTGKAVPSGKTLLSCIPPKAVVVNFSVPNPIGEVLMKKRPDIIFCEGGLLSFDTKRSTQSCNVRLFPGETYACLAGTMVHAYKGWRHHEVGPVDMNTISETWEAAVELGFFLKPLPQPGNHSEGSASMPKPLVAVEKGEIAETHNALVRLIRVPVIAVLNKLPAKLSKRLFLTFSERGGDPAIVAGTVTTYAALENMYTFRKRQAAGEVRLPDVVWQNLGNAMAIRNRVSLTIKILMKAIEETRTRKEEVQLCSLGSGSARAVVEALKQVDGQSRVKCLFIDISGKALKYGQELARAYNIKSEIERRRDYAENLAIHCNGNFKPDIIEMVGLLDYYPHEGAVKLVSEIYRELAPGGWLITCNITHNLEEPFVTKGIGWPLIYRSPQELMNIMGEAGFAAEQTHLVAEPQRIHILAVARKL